MPTPWFIVVTGANFLLARNTCHPVNYMPYQSPGFFNMGLDLVGPFKKAKGGFTKWIKENLLASITTAKAAEFVKEIMY
jgi:hypothetical protein